MDPKLDKLAKETAAEIAAALGNDLVSIILHGSAVRGDFVPGRSDLNILVVAKKVDESMLDRLIGMQKGWRKNRVALPLFLTPHDIESSLDAFPMEYQEMKAAYRVLKGDDILAPLQIDAKDLRLQCEREARGKLIQLRRAFVKAGAKTKDLEELFRLSLKSFLAIMRSLLRLAGQEPPADDLKIIDAAARIIGRDLVHFKRTLEFRQGNPKMGRSDQKALFSGYLAETDALVEWIDGFAENEE